MQNPALKRAALAAACAMTLATAAATEPPKAVTVEAYRRTGAGPSRNELVRQCQMVTRAVGPVARYRSGDQELTAAELRDCNRLAISISSPRN